MWGRRGRWEVSSLLAAALPLLQQLLLGLVAAQSSQASTWKTLSGTAPVIIAKGGFSGLFPDSSDYAYNFALIASSSNTTLWCDVQLTKDGIGICVPDLKLDNCTNIADLYPKGKNTYPVNGVPTAAWFPVDYNSTELAQVSLKQAIYTRTYRFDASFPPILAVEDVVSKFKPPAYWVNVQNDVFYNQFNMSMKSYILSVSKRVAINYISSPEVDFLSSIAGKVSSKTKLVFCFLDETISEPSTNQSYGSLFKNLTLIKNFASGILVPKHYIWPVTSDNYLQSYTSAVTDAHKAGLEIYAADFANDNIISYNYSYDPLAECLSFIDNGAFSVDGVVSDFPITLSEAVGCFTNLDKSSINHGKPVIISHNGASGDYPDCTDLAYQKAVDDGADVIDCSVQVTQDGILICMSSIDLMEVTTVAQSPLRSRMTVVPEIQSSAGIFTFNLTWDEIVKNLKPTISAPFSTYKLGRNPRYRNAGNFMKLSDFLAFAEDKNLSGILISVEQAAFIAKSLRFDVIDSIVTSLGDAGYNNQTVLQVMIQSSNSSVLAKFKQQTKYKLVYMINEDISDVTSSSLTDIKKFADAVAIEKESVYPATHYFTEYQTNLVKHLQAANLSVYVYVLQNEFLSQPYDFFSDATVEINTYVQGAKVDGIITDFPATARRYKMNACLNMGNNTPDYMNPVKAGGLLELISKTAQPPVEPPSPVLSEADVVEAPLPTVASNDSAAPSPSQHAGEPRTKASAFITLLAMVCATLFF